MHILAFAMLAPFIAIIVWAMIGTFVMVRTVREER